MKNIITITLLLIALTIISFWTVSGMPEKCNPYQEKWADGCVTKSEYLP